jgi:hypothetical protein
VPIPPALQNSKIQSGARPRRVSHLLCVCIAFIGPILLACSSTPPPPKVKGCQRGDSPVPAVEPPLQYPLPCAGGGAPTPVPPIHPSQDGGGRWDGCDGGVEGTPLWRSPTPPSPPSHLPTPYLQLGPIRSEVPTSVVCAHQSKRSRSFREFINVCPPSHTPHDTRLDLVSDWPPGVRGIC